jgi:hypothetical protein
VAGATLVDLAGAGCALREGQSQVVATSCIRLPDGPEPGTRTQHTNSALPMSNATTRSMTSSLSCVSISTSPPRALIARRPTTPIPHGTGVPSRETEANGPSSHPKDIVANRCC